MAGIQVREVEYAYVNTHTRDVVHALGPVSLSVEDGEFVAVVGPSGCGKTTLLYLVAGLLRPTGGAVYVDGRPVRGPGPDRGMVFQETAILPWRTVRQNIGHGLEIRGDPPQAREVTVARLVQLCGLGGFEDKYPHELSGGMRQRVAVARTLAINPKVVLMDEPFAALDAQTRITLGEELLRIVEHTRSTVLFVTHNVDEAVFLGDRVVVLTRRPGRVKHEFRVAVPRERRTYQGILATSALEPLKREVFAMIRAEVSEGGQEVARVPSPRRGIWRWARHRAVLGIAAGCLAWTTLKGVELVGAPSRVQSDVWDQARRGGQIPRLEVTLVVPAEEYHVRTLQRWGILERVERNRVVLRRVQRGGLQRIAQLYWVSRVSLPPGTGKPKHGGVEAPGG